MTPIRKTLRIVCSLTTAAIAAQLLLAQHRKVILDDSRAHVTLVTLVPGQSYVAEGAKPHGSVWVTLDLGLGATLVSSAGPEMLVVQGRRELVPTLGPGSVLRFSCSDRAEFARVVIVDVKSAAQPLTLQSEILASAQEMEDGSDRNDTLLIAESVLQLQDVLDIGGEGNPRMGHPRTIHMATGGVTWVRQGMHYIKNLLPTSAKFTLIEW